MRIELSARVYTSDGREAGKVSQLVVERDGNTLDSIIMHTGMLGTVIIVPASDIRQVAAPDTLHLAITEAQVQALPTYIRQNFVTSENIEAEDMGYMTAGGGQVMMPTGGMGGSMTPIGLPGDAASGSFIGMANANYYTVQEQGNFSDDEFLLGRSTRVVTADDHNTGTVHEIETSADGKLTAMIFTSGHIRTHRYRITLDQVQSLGTDEVRLRVAADELAAMEQHDQAAANQQ